MKHLDQDPSLQRLLRQFPTLSFQEMEDIFLVVIIWLSRFVTSFSMFFYLCFYLQYTNTFGQTQNSNWMLLHQKSLHDVILISIFNYLQLLQWGKNSWCISSMWHRVLYKIWIYSQANPTRLWTVLVFELCLVTSRSAPMRLLIIFLLHTQLWDLNMDSGPVSTFQVHEHLRPKVKFPRSND